VASTEVISIEGPVRNDAEIVVIEEGFKLLHELRLAGSEQRGSDTCLWCVTVGE